MYVHQRYTCTFRHTPVHAQICVYKHVYTCICMNTLEETHTCTNFHTLTHVSTYLCPCVHILASTCIHTHVHTCTHMYTTYILTPMLTTNIGTFNDM